MAQRYRVGRCSRWVKPIERGDIPLPPINKPARPRAKHVFAKLSLEYLLLSHPRTLIGFCTVFPQLEVEYYRQILFHASAPARLVLVAGPFAN